MKKVFSKTSKFVGEGDILNIGRLRLRVKKDCGVSDTRNNEKAAIETAENWSKYDRFYATDNHRLLYANGRVFAAAKI